MLKEWPPPPYLVDAACLRPHYVVCRGLSITREALLLLVGLANFLRQLIPADAIAHAGAQLPLERFRLGIDPGPDLIEPLAEDVDVSSVRTVEVEEALISIERVEAAVALVAERLEQLLHRLTLLGGSDEIEVGVLALQGRLPGTGTVKVDGGAAYQFDR